MWQTSKKQNYKGGFTLVELLTVMAIIAVLIGLLVPAVTHVRNQAKVVQTQAQIKGIETALEAFAGMYGDYPPSSRSGSESDDTVAPYTVGAQKLAEALVGADLRGFDPRSNFNRHWLANNVSSQAEEAYASEESGQTEEQELASLRRRKGPYIAINENVGVYNVSDLYETYLASGGTANIYRDDDPTEKEFNHVITDNFKNHTITFLDYEGEEVTIKAGSPILYYKADPSKRKFERTATDGGTDLHSDNIYNWEDNEALVELGRITRDGAYSPHKWYDDPIKTESEAFYDYISNPRVASQQWPHNPDTYLLISAGPDGIFGTEDDIANFEIRGAQ